MPTNRKDLISEHETIERDLIELDTIMHSSIINYPNLIHVLKNLRQFWEQHEQKEDIFFDSLYNKGFPIPVKKISFEHGKLKRDMDIILRALQSGSEDEMHTVLFKYGKDLISQMRKHMADEDWILYALPKKF